MKPLISRLYMSLCLCLSETLWANSRPSGGEISCGRGGGYATKSKSCQSWARNQQDKVDRYEGKELPCINLSLFLNSSRLYQFHYVLFWCFQTEEEKVHLERKTQEAERLTARLVDESERRAAEADRLKDELLKARIAEKQAKEKLLQFLSRTASPTTIQPVPHSTHSPTPLVSIK